jgi:RNA polymerase sigma factor (sigma-70 family)
MNVVAPDDSATLLCEYARHGSDAAFAELVRRHINMVYTTALRRARGDSAMAEDIAQRVFVDLAARARSLPANVILAGWLYRHTSFVAATFLRSEHRRRVRERASMELRDHDEPTDWSAVAPVLEEAMESLPARDRDALVLRFLDQQPLAQVGASLGISEDAARMRVDRALDRLRALLARRGARSTVAALALALGQHATLSAPHGLAASIAAHAISGAAVAATFASAGSTATAGFMGTMTTKFTLSAAALITAGAVTTAIVESNARKSIEDQLTTVRMDLNAATDLANAAGARATASEADAAEWRTQRAEIMELRDKAARLRELQQELDRLRTENKDMEAARADVVTRKPDSNAEDAAAEFERQVVQGLALARMNYLKDWMLAFINFAQEEGGGVIPTSFTEAAKFFPKDPSDPASVLDPNRFEIVYDGSLSEVADPARTIVIREKEAFKAATEPGAAPRFLRAYAFADGHTEIHATPTEDATEWERQRMVPSAAR